MQAIEDPYKKGEALGQLMGDALPASAVVGGVMGKVGKWKITKAGKAAKVEGGVVKVQIGTKLEYVFGRARATGPAHNVRRSEGMLKQLQSVGIYDNKAGRSLLRSHLKDAYGDTKGIILQSNGRYLRESILMGPNGALKVESIWEGNKLITVKLFGGK